MGNMIPGIVVDKESCGYAQGSCFGSGVGLGSGGLSLGYNNPCTAYGSGRGFGSGDAYGKDKDILAPK